jgi:hypothetical protein
MGNVDYLRFSPTPSRPPCPSRNCFWFPISCQRMRPGPAYVSPKMHHLFPRRIMWFALQRISVVVSSPKGKSGLSYLESHMSQWAWADGWNRLGKFSSRHSSSVTGAGLSFTAFPGWMVFLGDTGPKENMHNEVLSWLPVWTLHSYPFHSALPSSPHTRKPRDFTQLDWNRY